VEKGTRFTSGFFFKAGILICLIIIVEYFYAKQGPRGLIIITILLALAGLMVAAVTKPHWLVTILYFILGIFAMQLLVPGFPLSLRASWMLMGMITVSWLIGRVWQHKAIIRTSFDFPFFLFLISGFLALLNGIVSGWFWKTAFHEACLIILPAILFFPLRDLFAKEDILFFRITVIPLIAGATISASYAIYCSLSGTNFALDLFQPDIHTLILMDLDRTAALVPSNSFLFAFYICLALVVGGQSKSLPRSGAIVVIFICLGGILVGMTRTRWAVLVIGTAVFMGFILFKRKLKGISKTACIFLIFILAFLLFQTVTGYNIRDLISSRIYMLQATHLSSLEHRLAETIAFLHLFLDRPAMGNGLGAEITFYSPSFMGLVSRTNWHNDYAMILAKMGLLGIISFTWIFMIAIYQGFYVFRNTYEYQDQILIASLLSYLISAAIAAATISFFSAPSSGPVVIAVCAYLAVRSEKLRKSKDQINKIR
jgi:hypothetical protein